MNFNFFLEKIIFLLLFFLFFNTSCELEINEPVQEYLEYWSENVTIAKYSVKSECKVINNQKNLSIKSPINLEVIITNPQNYDLKVKDTSNSYFQIYNRENKDVSSEELATLSTDKTVIDLQAKLSDDTEDEILTVKGYFTVVKQGVNFSNCNYSYSFRQSTPPDKPDNLRNPKTAENDGYHCVHFFYPNQSLKRNRNLKYSIRCFLYENGNFTQIDSKILTSDDSKSNNPNEFVYYFDKQEPSLLYDYIVEAIKPNGLKSETVSTSEKLGICYVTEPEFIFGANGTFTGNKADLSETSYDVIEYTGSNLELKVVNTNENSNMQVTINGNPVSAVSILQEGFNTIEVSISKNLCRPISVKKYIYVTKELTAPTIEFTNKASESTNKITYSYLTYENLKMKVTNNYDKPGSTMTVTVDDTTITNFEDYTLSDGFHTIIATITKPYCNTKTTTKTATVKIKPVNVTVGTTALHCHFTDGAGSSNEIYGKLYIGKNNNFKLLRQFSDAEFKENDWDNFGHNDVGSFVLENKSDKICYKSEDMYEADTGADDEISEVNTSITLTDISKVMRTSNTINFAYRANAYKDGQSVKIEVKSSGDNEVSHRIYLNLSE